MPSTSTCDICFSTFSRKGDLKRHSHLHTGTKPHKCDDCGKRFTQSSALRTHRNVHTGNKPYACEIGHCEAAFGDPSSRARHRKEIHRIIGGYRCPIFGCPSSIKRFSAFTAHLKKHGIDPSTVDLKELAPPNLPQPSFERPSQCQRLQPQSKTDIMVSNAVYSSGVAHVSLASDMNIPYYSNRRPSDYTPNTSDWLTIFQFLEHSKVPASELYTMDPPPPDLVYSLSPSPSPSRDLDVLCTPNSLTPSASPPSPLAQAKHRKPHDVDFESFGFEDWRVYF